MAESQLNKLMKNLGIFEDEAREILAEDKLIDRGEKMPYDLPPDKLKVAQTFTKADRKPTAYKFTPRQRKENPTKADIIREIFQHLPHLESVLCENVEITNKERQISFSVGENKYELTLTQKRKPKN